MLKFRIKAPCKVCRYNEETYESCQVDIGEKYFLLEGCLNQHPGFLDDLANYICQESESLPVVAIFPDPDVKKDKEGLYIEINAYSNSPIISENELEKIVDYIKGQVSDGWGEEGFELYNGMHLEFDWKNVKYIDYSTISFEEFDKIYKDYCLLTRKNLPCSEIDINKAIKEATELIKEATKLLDEMGYKNNGVNI